MPAARRLGRAAGAVLLALAGVACGEGGGGAGPSSGAPAGLVSATGAAADGGGVLDLDRPASVELRGSATVPGPGDARARGVAVVVVPDDRGEVCVELRLDDLAGPTAAHLHEGVAGEAGGVVLALPIPAAGEAAVDACVSASPAVLDGLRADPAGFFLDVHSDGHPAGAVRGQLAGP